MNNRSLPDNGEQKMQTMPIYSYVDGPFTGVMIEGHGLDLTQEPARGAVAKQIKEEFALLFNNPNTQAAKLLLVRISVDCLRNYNKSELHGRYEATYYDEAADEDQTVYFSFKECPPEPVPDDSESIFYDYHDEPTEHTTPITVIRWADDVSEQLIEEIEESGL